MKRFLKGAYGENVERPIDFRVRLFHILAFGGITISFFTVLISLVTHMWMTAALAASLIAFSAGLVIFTWKTGKYQVAYFFTVVVIFMIVLPMMFFSSGGHRSGMPSIFLLAVLFTVLMIKGKRALLLSVFEIVEYSFVCVYAFHHPELVSHYETEAQILTDIIFAFTCVSIVCGIVIFFYLREYDYQRELLREQNEKLKRYDASRSAFLTTVSHEVNNPLNAINLHAHDTLELMEEDPPNAELIQNNQRVIEQMVARIDRILTDLKDTVAIEQGRLALNLAPMRLSKLLRDVAGTYFRREDSAGNELILEVDDTLPPIDADYARIVQVVANLLSNAMQHTKDGKIKISLYMRTGEQIVVISDNGEGMKKEIREQVFKGYVSSDKEYWRHGIGLYVSHQIVEAHGGRIWIDSKLGEGTTVTFTLPDRRTTL